MVSEVSNMSKFCVFCGKKPENKNKEHIIPQWLSKHTGRFDKICHMNESTTSAKIPFCSLTFPACTKCNDAFGKMEAAVKPILLDLMASKPLNAEQISLLLDWFDKIRVGLWLSELTLSKQVDFVKPKFHIADRVGQKDRMLIIDRIKDLGQGLAFVGTDSPMFIEMPSAFALIVEDFIFTNASEIGLVSGKLGFPNTGKIPLGRNANGVSLDLRRGRDKTTHPVVSNYQASPSRTLIYQPMYKCYRGFENSPEFNAQYVLEHSLDFAAGTGGIFYQRGDNAIKYLGDGQSVSLAPSAQPTERWKPIVQEVFKLQNFVLTNRFDLNSGSKIDRMDAQQNLLKNQMIISAYGKSK